MNSCRDMVDIVHYVGTFKVYHVQKLSPKLILDQSFIEAGYAYVKGSDDLGTCTFYGRNKWRILNEKS